MRASKEGVRILGKDVSDGSLASYMIHIGFWIGAGGHGPCRSYTSSTSSSPSSSPPLESQFFSSIAIDQTEEEGSPPQLRSPPPPLPRRPLPPPLRRPLSRRPLPPPPQRPLSPPPPPPKPLPPPPPPPPPLPKPLSPPPPPPPRPPLSPPKSPLLSPPKPLSPQNPRRALCGCIFIFLLLASITVLTVWLVYRPQKPHFTVVGAAVFDLNSTTSPPFVSTTMQFIIVTRNANKRVSILYDHLSTFVSYHNQMITQPVVLQPLFQEKHSTVQLSPMIGGGGPVPVSPEVSYGLEMDEGYGVVGLRLVLLGKLRWKAGAITTGRYGIYVKCDLSLRWCGKGSVGQVPMLSSPVCSVDL